MSYMAMVRSNVLRHIESIRFKEQGWGRWKYMATMPRPWALQASSMTIYILEVLDQIKNVTEQQKQEYLDFVYSCYDETDRFFKDPLENESIRQGPHTWRHIWGQRNGSVLGSLKILGLTPRTELIEPAILADYQNVSARDWTLALDWSDPWMVGEVWLRLVLAFVNRYPGKDIIEDVPYVRDLFEVIENDILDPATGMPTKRGCQDDKPRAMAGLFKILMGYVRVGRPLPYPEQAVDFTLDLQFKNGEFGYPRDMTMNWDALWVLYYYNQQMANSYRFEDIRQAGNRLAEVLLNDYRKSDGGFAFHADHCLMKHCSIILCEKPEPISDVVGTWMALQCFRYADEWNSITLA